LKGLRMITIDGSFGEGGGQILRTSLALSLVTGTAFRIERIRAGREKPGLRQQHLVAVMAAAKVGSAEVEGADLGSQELFFCPKHVRAGRYRFSVGTAGSATLVLQTVLPPLLMMSEGSTLELEGGTHNPLAPPYDFLQRAFLPLLRKMGPEIVAELERPGFYPAGGGRMTVVLEPAPKLSPIEIVERGKVRRFCVHGVVAGLPRHIAEREVQAVLEAAGWGKECGSIKECGQAYGPGNVVTADVECEHVTEVFTGFGQRGVRAEDVGKRVGLEAARYIEAGVPVWEHLADQLLLPMALAGGGSFLTSEPSLHAHTNMDIIRRFIDIPFRVEPLGNGAWQISAG
jgi:RNA 3'-terminal phosphate cyclase (ATP)